MRKIKTANLTINNSDVTSIVLLRNIFETESREMPIQMASVSVINEFVCERQNFIARLMGILTMNCFFVMNNGTEIMELFFEMSRDHGTLRIWRFRGYESQKFVDSSIGEFAEADVCEFEKSGGQKFENFDIGKFDRSNVRKL